MKAFRAGRNPRIFGEKESGVGLIETLVALALLGIIAASFLGGLATASKAAFTADERATAECLARSQLEYVKGQGYISHIDPEHGDYLVITTTPAGYNSVETTAVPIDPATGQPLAPGEDNGIQKITITVKHDDKSVLIVSDFKRER